MSIATKALVGGPVHSPVSGPIKKKTQTKNKSNQANKTHKTTNKPNQTKNTEKRDRYQL